MRTAKHQEILNAIRPLIQDSTIVDFTTNEPQQTKA